MEIRPFIIYINLGGVLKIFPDFNNPGSVKLGKLVLQVSNGNRGQILSWLQLKFFIDGFNSDGKEYILVWRHHCSLTGL